MAPYLIRQHECAGWSAPLLFTVNKSQGFSCLFSYDVESRASWSPPGYVPDRNEKNIKKFIEFIQYIFHVTKTYLTLCFDL